MQVRLPYILFPVFSVLALGIILPIFSKKPTAILSPLTEKTYAVVPTLTNTPTPTSTLIPTPTPTLLPPTSTSTPKPIFAPADLENLFTKLSNEYSVDKELLKRIANCESGLNPSISTSHYAGLYQFSEALWVSTRNLMGYNSDVGLRFNAEEAIRTAAFMIAQGNLHIWPNCNK